MILPSSRVYPENIIPNMLPKMLTGSVCAQWVKCGRSTCRCTQGQLHGPYFYRFWREDGKLRKEYIPRAIEAEIRDQCEAYRRRGQDLAKDLKIFQRFQKTLLSLRKL